MPEARKKMGIVEHRGLIYIIGGYTYTYNPLHDLLSYNPVTGEWKNLAPMLGPPSKTIGVAVLDNFLMGIVEHRGLIYIIGGYTYTYNPLHDLLSYNPVTGEWKNLAPMLGPPSKTIGVAVLDNFFGYMDFYNPMHDLLSYNPVTGEWRALAGRAPPRYNYMGVAVLNNFLMGIVEHRGLIYIMGGYTDDTDNDLRDLLSYNPVTEEWKNLAPMLGEPCDTISVAVLNNFLYVVGGTELEEMERYSFEQNQWFKCSSSEYLGRSSPAVVVTNSLLYVIGGYWSGLNGIGMVRKEE
ncbi:kelch-like protein 2 [Homarus americanus]|uniref:kelch-like protein 2 n=1 Tax=Homarus americanus TaxID=6706 RepID=UPI001C43939D|nr:kelch-like protein 2 [Homarus americanus]